MPNEKGNLFIHEAVALRKEYDNHIKLLQELLSEPGGKKGGFLSRDNDETKQPVEDFKQADFEDTLKKLQTRRLKLNQDIQSTHSKTVESAYSAVIHKEERDIVERPPFV